MQAFNPSLVPSRKLACRLQPLMFEFRIRITSHTRTGLLGCCLLLAQLLPGVGIGMLEPTCSSCGWVNLGSSLRKVETWSSMMVIGIFFLGQNVTLTLRQATNGQLNFTKTCQKSQDLAGNPASFNVVTGNATAKVINCILVPLAIWLNISLTVEQPVGEPSQLRDHYQRLRPQFEHWEAKAFFLECI